MIKVFEAFSGYGSQTLALKKYGIEFESVGIAEIDKYAIAAHENLHGKVKNYGDVSLLSVDELPCMDLFTYSFPCQDISNAGKQRGFEKGSGTRSSLLWECERIIEGKRPMFLMMENVKNLVGKKNKPNFEIWLKTLENLGYNNYWKVVNAKWCGVPQNRERVFCVSIRKDMDFGQFHFEEDFDNGIRLKDILESEVDEKYYVNTEKSKELLIGLNESIVVKQATKQGFDIAYPGDSINLEQPNSKTRRGRVGKEICNTLTTSCNIAVVEPNIIKVGNISPNNFNSMDILSSEGIAKTLLANGGGNTEPKVLEIGLLNKNRYSSVMNASHSTNGICRTIDTVQGGLEPKILVEGNVSPNNHGGGTMYSTNGISRTVLSRDAKDPVKVYNNLRIRKLTPRECFRLMGLSEDEIDKIQATIVNNKPISNSQQYRLAGNSIVINSMEFLKNLELNFDYSILL